MLRIGIDIKAYSLYRAGIGWFIESTMQSILEATRSVEFVVFYPQGTKKLGIRDGRVNYVGVPLGLRGKAGLRILWYDQVSLPRKLRLYGLDVFWSPWIDAPLRLNSPLVLTIHDLGLLEPSGALSLKAGVYYKALLKINARRACYILTESHFTRDNIVGRLHVPERKVKVVYIKTRPSMRLLESENEVVRILRSYGLSRGYILYSGGVGKRKNIPNMLRAWKILRENYDLNLPLVLLGRKEAYQSDLEAIFGCNDHEDILLPGFVPDEELVVFYNGAELVLYPSLYEGFGLPVVEGFACGTPVLCSRVTSLPEVGGEAAMYFDPRCPRDIAEKMHDVLTDEGQRHDMIRKGFLQAMKFQETDVDSLLAVFAQCASREKKHNKAFGLLCGKKNK